MKAAGGVRLRLCCEGAAVVGSGSDVAVKRWHHVWLEVSVWKRWWVGRNPRHGVEGGGAAVVWREVECGGMAEGGAVAGGCIPPELVVLN